MDDRLHLLVVEDNPDTQKLLQYMLKEPYVLQTASGVDEALHVADAAETPLDVFVIDINLGEKRTGSDLLAALRERPRYAATPAIALTAYALPGDGERFLAQGFDLYLSKPFSRSDLHTILERAARLRDQTDA